jgi:hypothetical protein
MLPRAHHIKDQLQDALLLQRVAAVCSAAERFAARSSSPASDISALLSTNSAKLRYGVQQSLNVLWVCWKPSTLQGKNHAAYLKFLKLDVDTLLFAPINYRSADTFTCFVR